MKPSKKPDKTKNFSIAFVVEYDRKKTAEMFVSGDNLKRLQDEFNEKILAKKRVKQYITIDNFTGEKGSLRFGM